MKKIHVFLLVMVATFLALTGLVLADNFADVPPGHWAYEAVDYLKANNMLEGFPGGNFNGDRTLTRYEFAQLISRYIKDMAGKDLLDPNAQALLERLRSEFKKELDEINNRIKTLEEVNAFDGERITAIEQDVKKVNDWIGKTDPAITNLLKTRWRGDLRYRFLVESSDENVGPGLFNNGEDRYRQRLRFRFGATHEIDDSTSVTWRLATGRDSNGTSANYTLGSNANGAGSSIGLDLAYFKWAPWGTRTTDGQAKKNVFWLYGGLTPRVEDAYTTLLFSNDYSMQGITAQYVMNNKCNLTGWFRQVSEQPVDLNGEGSWDDDVTMAGIQLSGKEIFGLEGVNGYAGYYAWSNVERLSTGINNVGGLNFVPDFDNNSATTGMTELNRINGGDYGVINVGLQYEHKLFDKPALAWGDWAYNTNDFLGDYANMYDLNDNDRMGWIVGYRWGLASSKVPKSWHVSLEYGDIGYWTTPGTYTDAGYLGVGGRGWSGQFRYQMTPNLYVNYNLILQQRNLWYVDNTSSPLNVRQNNMTSHYLDWIWSF